MGWVIPLRCDSCRRAFRFRTGVERFYSVMWQSADLPLTERVPCFDRDGWCHRCRRPRAIELLPLPGMPLDPARARWHAERVSPPRCLYCGSTAVEVLSGDFRHPDCGGRIVVSGTPEHFSPAVAYFVPPEGPRERSCWLRRTLRCT